MERRRPKTAPAPQRPIASRAEVFAALVAIQSVAIGDALAAPDVPAPAASAAPASPPSALGSSGMSTAPVAPPTPSGMALVDVRATEDMPVPDLGTGAKLTIRTFGAKKPIVYVDGRPVPSVAWASLDVSPGTHEVAVDWLVEGTDKQAAKLESQRVSVVQGGSSQLTFGHDPNEVRELGGAMPQDTFARVGSGCCGAHTSDTMTARAAVPMTLLGAALLLARRRRRPPPT